MRLPRLAPQPSLLDLRFLELDMLAHDGIIFLEAELLGLGPRILLRDVEETGVGRVTSLILTVVGFAMT